LPPFTVGDEESITGREFPFVDTMMTEDDGGGEVHRMRIYPVPRKRRGSWLMTALDLHHWLPAWAAVALIAAALVASWALGHAVGGAGRVPPHWFYVPVILAASLKNFEQLLARASEVTTLEHDKPSEEAFWAAGQLVVDESDQVIAVWDGKPAGGLGGTADVVRYAEKSGKEVLIIWPDNARRR
jgi:hypothetical protein